MSLCPVRAWTALPPFGSWLLSVAGVAPSDDDPSFTERDPCTSLPCARGRGGAHVGRAVPALGKQRAS